MKTERLTFLMTPEDKAAITARASELHIPASELVRRAVEAYDPERDEEALAVLADQLAAVVDKTEEKVDAAVAELKKMRTYFAELERDAPKGAA